MGKQSAGLVMYRLGAEGPELLLVHPGGPFWARKDLGAWSIPKGEYLDGEDPFTVAQREFAEETGLVPEGTFLELVEIRQAGGKKVKSWAIAGDFDPETLVSNRFTMEWPPRSGRQAEFPEVDRAGWFTIHEARQKILPSQLPLIDQIVSLLSSGR